MPITRKEIGYYRIVKPMIVFLVPVILIIIFANIYPHDKNSSVSFLYRNPGLLILYLPPILGTRLGQDNLGWLGGLSMVCAYLLIILSSNLDKIMEYHDYLSVQIATHPIVIITLSILIIRLLYKSFMNRDSYLFNEPRGGMNVEDR